MDEHRRAGHHIVMVTGSLDFLIAPLAALLEVPTLLAARPGTAGTPIHPATSVRPSLWPRQARTDRATRGIPALILAHSFAYGDGPGDVEVAGMVGHPLVVNPIRGMGRIAQRTVADHHLDLKRTALCAIPMGWRPT